MRVGEVFARDSQQLRVRRQMEAGQEKGRGADHLVSPALGRVL
jgi:hypothetical protein